MQRDSLLSGESRLLDPRLESQGPSGSRCDRAGDDMPCHLRSRTAISWQLPTVGLRHRDVKRIAPNVQSADLPRALTDSVICRRADASAGSTEHPAGGVHDRRDQDLSLVPSRRRSPRPLRDRRGDAQVNEPLSVHLADLDDPAWNHVPDARRLSSRGLLAVVLQPSRATAPRRIGRP